MTASTVQHFFGGSDTTQPLEFVEWEDFTEDIVVLDAEEDLWNLQNELMKNPLKGRVLNKGVGGGLRKIRMGMDETGKSGGARVLYLYIPSSKKVIFVNVFTKGDFEDLPIRMQRYFGQLAMELRQEYSQ